MKEVTKVVTRRWERALHGLTLTALALLAAAGLGAVMHPMTAEAKDKEVTIVIRWHLHEMHSTTIGVPDYTSYGAFESDIPSVKLDVDVTDDNNKNIKTIQTLTMDASAKDNASSTNDVIVWKKTFTINDESWVQNGREIKWPLNDRGMHDLVNYFSYYGKSVNGNTYTFDMKSYCDQVNVQFINYAMTPPLGLSNADLPEKLTWKLQRKMGDKYVDVMGPIENDFFYTNGSTTPYYIYGYEDQDYRVVFLDQYPNYLTRSSESQKRSWQYWLPLYVNDLYPNMQVSAAFVTPEGEPVEVQDVPESISLQVLGSADGGASYQTYDRKSYTISTDPDSADYDQAKYYSDWGMCRTPYYSKLSPTLTWTVAGGKIAGYKAPTVSVEKSGYEEFGITKDAYSYTITYVLDTVPAIVQTPASTWHCTHHYVWVTHEKATAIKDGAMRYQCEYCGTVKYTVPITAYYAFNKDTQEKVLNASQGATVKVQTPLFISFHEMVLKALQDRPDVTLVVDYKSGDGLYEMTIPAGSGTQLAQLFGDSQYAGFLYLGGAYQTTQLPDDTRFDNVPDYLLWVGTEFAH